MERRIEQVVLRAIETMRANLGDEIGIDDLARVAVFSRLHFSRVFHRVTGVSPGRFLTAVRIEEAKRLLTSTSLPVAEISHRVGYSSVGSFTEGFTLDVGASPTTYRQLGRTAGQGWITPHRGALGGGRGSRSSTIRGTVASPLGDRPVLVGLFQERIMQGVPVRSTILPRPGPYVLEDIPPGAWHLLACSVAADHDEDDTAEDTLHVGRGGPVVIRCQADDHLADIRLSPEGPLDPPVLLALDGLWSPQLAASVS